MSKLIVYLKDIKAGELRQTASQQLTFQYDADWLLSQTMPLSLSLPLQREAFSDQKTRGFFANLLPEGQIRQYLARRIGISEKNDFALLQAIAGENAGAVKLLPAEMPQHIQGHYQLLDKEELAKTLKELPRQPFLYGQKEVRLSLAGAQNKLPVYISHGQVYIPSGDYPSSHIIKPPLEHFAASSENEWFCMQLAEAIGLPVPPVQLWQIPVTSYIIERFDRVKVREGQLIRLHQEDFCQALSVLPEHKYEAEGGPTLVQCFEVLRRYSKQPSIDMRLLIQWVIYNFLIGNADGHAKNIALLFDEQGVRLAPFYDLLSTLVYPDLSQKVAMKIGGENRFDWIQTRHWQRFAEDIGIKYQIIENLLQTMSVTVMTKANEVKKPLGNNKIINEIVTIIKKRTEHIRQNMK